MPTWENAIARRLLVAMSLDTVLFILDLRVLEAPSHRQDKMLWIRSWEIPQASHRSADAS